MKSQQLILLLTIFFFACMETPKTAVAPTDVERIATNKSLVEYWIYEGWNKNRNMEIIDSVFAQDWRDLNPLPGTPPGIEGARYFVNIYRKALPDIQFKITHLVAEPDWVVFRFTAEATHRDTLIGVPGTGKRIATSGIVMHKVVNGRFAESVNEIDLLGILQQIQSR